MKRSDSRQPDTRLIRLLGGVELAPLRQRLRRHFERHAGKMGSSLQLTNLAPAEQEALALMTGRPPRAARSMRVDIKQLDDSLRAAGIAESLRAALEMLDGPIEDRAALRQARLLRWAQVLCAEHWHPTLRLWLQTPTAVALLKRLARNDHRTAEQLLEQSSRVMGREYGGAAASATNNRITGLVSYTGVVFLYGGAPCSQSTFRRPRTTGPAPSRGTLHKTVAMDP